MSKTIAQRDHFTSPFSAVLRERRILISLLFSGFILLGMTLFFGLPKHAGGAESVRADLRGTPQLAIEIIGFDRLAGWGDDALGDALPVFLRSCAAMNKKRDDAPANPLEALGEAFPVESISGKIADWRPACSAAANVLNSVPYAGNERFRQGAVREFFQSYFVPVQIINRLEGDGLVQHKSEGTFTGYFEPVYPASRVRTSALSSPLYARPKDLIDLDLGAFREDLAGTRLAGRVKAGRLVPFEDRAQINDGAIAGKVDVLAWLHPDDAFFLQIQGSGVLTFPDNSVMRVGYAGQNGHPYTAIGKPLIERGEIAREDMSLDAIRAWLEQATPEAAQALREENASFVFFTTLSNLPEENLGPLGAQSVQLTAGRSLAADRRYHAMGTPAFVSIDALDRGRGDEAFARLMIIQDTGGAIRGPVRGDVFWGRGVAAKNIASPMNVKGELTVLLPRPVVERLRAQAQ